MNEADKPQDDPETATDQDQAGADDPIPASSTQAEAPDRDPAAWEGAEPGETVGLVDPRHEIPNPPGL